MYININDFSIPDIAVLSFVFVCFGVVAIVGTKALLDNLKQRNK